MHKSRRGLVINRMIFLNFSFICRLFSSTPVLCDACTFFVSSVATVVSGRFALQAEAAFCFWICSFRCATYALGCRRGCRMGGRAVFPARACRPGGFCGVSGPCVKQKAPNDRTSAKQKVFQFFFHDKSFLKMADVEFRQGSVPCGKPCNVHHTGSTLNGCRTLARQIEYTGKQHRTRSHCPPFSSFKFRIPYRNSEISIIPDVRITETSVAAGGNLSPKQV